MLDDLGGIWTTRRTDTCVAFVGENETPRCKIPLCNNFWQKGEVRETTVGRGEMEKARWGEKWRGCMSRVQAGLIVYKKLCTILKNRIIELNFFL